MKNQTDFRKKAEKGVDPRLSSPIYIYYGQLYGYHLCEWPSSTLIECDTTDCGGECGSYHVSLEKR